MNSDIDRAFEILCKRPRRLALVMVRRVESLTLDEVAARIDQESKNAELTLTHSHLPKLQEAGYIEWDRNTKTISKGPCFDEIEPILTVVENQTDDLSVEWPTSRFDINGRHSSSGNR